MRQHLGAFGVMGFCSLLVGVMMLANTSGMLIDYDNVYGAGEQADAYRALAQAQFFSLEGVHRTVSMAIIWFLFLGFWYVPICALGRLRARAFPIIACVAIGLSGFVSYILYSVNP